MAKQQKPNNDNKDVKKLLEDLYKIVQVTNSSSKEQVKINKELLKVMSLLQGGFAKNQSDAGELIDQLHAGLEVNDEFAKKWAKARGATKDDLDDIIKKFRELEKLDMDIIDNANDYIDLLEEQYDLMQDEFDISSKLLKSHRDISKAVQSSKDLAGKMGVSLSDVDSVVSKLVQKKVDLDSMFSGMFNDSLGISDLVGLMQSDIESMIQNTSGSLIDMNVRFSPLTDDLDKEVSKILETVNSERDTRLKGLQTYFEKNTKMQNMLARQMAIDFAGLSDIKIDVDTGSIVQAGIELQKGTDEYQNAVLQLDQIVDNNKIGETLKVRFEEINSLINSGIILTETQQQRLDDLLQPLDMATKMMLDEVKTSNDLLNIQTAMVLKERERFKIIAGNINQLTSFESIVTKIGSGFDYINSVLPSGVGEFLGLDKVSLSLLEAHKKGVRSFSESLGDGASKSQAMSAYFAELGPSILSALNPMTLIVAGSLLLLNYVTGITDKLKTMSSEMGISLGQANKLLTVQLDTLTSQKNQFATMQDIQDVQKEMLAGGSLISDLNTNAVKDLTISLSDMGKAFGYGSAEAAQLHKVFTNIGASDKLAESLQGNIGLMSEMIGMSPQIIGRDLVDSAEVVSTYFAGMPETAAKTVIQVRRMGMSLKQAGSIAQDMIGDMEGFMTDMYELQAMSGGGIDFSSAFDKGLTGDIAGMTKDIMETIGTTAEYNNMDYLTRMKIAKTLGMSVDDLGKSVKMHEKMAVFAGKEKTDIEANLDRMGDISNLSKDEIRNRLQQLQSTDRMMVAWDKIKGVLTKALLPAVELFADVIDGISPLLDIVIFAFKSIGGLVSALLPLFKVITVPIKFIGDILSQITGKIDDVAGSAGGLSSTLKTVVDVASGLLTIFVGSKILKGFGMINGGFGDMIGGMVKNIPIVGKLFGGLTSMMGGSSKDAAQKSIETTNAAVAPIHTLIEKVESSIKEMVEHVKASLTEMVESIKGSTASASSAVNVGVQQAGKKAKDTLKTVDVSATATIEKINKKGKTTTLVNESKTKAVFQTVGEIGSKAFAAMAVRSAMSFMQVKKDGTDAANGLSDSAMPIFETLAMSGGAMLTQYLSEGVEKVFTERLEKKFESGLDKLISSITKGLGKLPSSAKGSFGKIADMGKKLLSSVGIGGGVIGKLVGEGTGSIDAAVQPDQSSTSVVETITKKKEIIDQVKDSAGIDLPELPTEQIEKAQSMFDKFKEFMSGTFDSIVEGVKKAWGMLKDTLMEIVKFAGNVLKSITSAVGQSIKNLLKGIGDGLSSFKTSAVKGAAALLIVSAALWVTSKAIQNFASVEWSAMAKAGAALIGLAIAGQIIGKATGQMIMGAIGIAAMGAALIPAAFAINMFNDVEWSALGKAALAIIGLGVAGAVLGPMIPMMIAGAIGIAAMGAALIPAAIALNMFNTVDWSALAKAGVAIIGLGVAGAILGPMIPMMLMGAIGLAAMGAALIPAAIALKMFGDVDWSAMGKAGVAIVGLGVAAAAFGMMLPLMLAGALAMAAISAGIILFAVGIASVAGAIDLINPKPVDALAKSLVNLTKSVSAKDIIATAGALQILGMEMIAFSAMSFGSGIISGVGKLVGGDVLGDLERFAKLADPLTIVNNVLSKLSESLVNLSNVLANVDLSNIEKLKGLKSDFNFGEVISKKIESVISVLNPLSSGSAESDVAISPVQPPIGSPKVPSKQATAQNVNISNAYSSGNSQQSGGSNLNNNQSDIYNSSDRQSQELVFLMRQQNQLLEALLKKDVNVQMDGQKLNSIVKKYNNNNG